MKTAGVGLKEIPMRAYIFFIKQANAATIKKSGTSHQSGKGVPSAAQPRNRIFGESDSVPATVDDVVINF